MPRPSSTPPPPPPHFVRAERGAGGWAVLMPYKAQNGDVVTIQKNRHRVVVRLTFFTDLRGHLWKYERFGQIDRTGKFEAST